MKVALVSMRFDTKGGSERRTYQLAKGLIGAGHEVEIFANTVEDMDLDARVNVVPMIPWQSFARTLSFTRNVNGLLARRPDVDVVHNQIWPFTDGIVTVGGGCHAEYLERTGKSLYWLNPLHKVVLDLERLRYRPGGCRAVITNSGLVRENLLSRYPIPPERVFVVHNGVDSEKFSPENISVYRAKVRSALGLTDEPVCLFVGTGFERKGLGTLIRALPLVRGFDRLKVVVVGRGSETAHRRLADLLGVGGRVIFAGTTTRPEEYFGAADMFVLPTLYDPFSNATVEAMACGLPVVTTAQNGVSEVIEDGVSGMVVADPSSHEELASAISRLSDVATRVEMGENARRAASGLTWARTLEKTVEVYRATA